MKGPSCCNSCRQSHSTCLLPVMTEDSFRIPRASHQILNTDLNGCDVAELVGKLFQKIAVHVSPQDGEDVVMQCVAAIAQRMNGKLVETATQTLQRIVPREPLQRPHRNVCGELPERLTDEEDPDDACGLPELGGHTRPQVTEQPEVAEEGGFDVCVEPFLFFDEDRSVSDNDSTIALSLAPYCLCCPAAEVSRTAKGRNNGTLA